MRARSCRSRTAAKQCHILPLAYQTTSVCAHGSSLGSSYALVLGILRPAPAFAGRRPLSGRSHGAPTLQSERVFMSRSAAHHGSHNLSDAESHNLC